MSIKAKVTGSGNSPLSTLTIVGEVSNSLTAAGTTQANALAIGNDINVITTTAASTGVVLPATLSAGDQITVVNYGASTLNVFPPVGGKINNGTTNAAVTLATLKNAQYTCIDGLNFFGNLSA